MDVVVENKFKPSDSNEEASASTSNSGENPITRLGLCEVCAFREAKYTCPKCEVKTCSLRCNKIHKLELECDGQRDRTKFVPMNKFTNLDLSSDYRLLEEITRNVQASRKKFESRWANIPGQLIKFRYQAHLRNVTLKFLPFKFSRHRNNTSHYNSAEHCIYWHMDWIFDNADNFKQCVPKVKESEKLSAILSKLLDTPDNEPLSEKLQYYKSAGIPGLKLYLKAEQRVGKKFFEIDPTLTVSECLKKKIIIEYPTIHVVLKDHGCGYEVIDSDDEEIKVEVKSGNEVVESIINNNDSEESIYKSMKNLLFISEYSEEED